jgi:hypothetical protein
LSGFLFHAGIALGGHHSHGKGLGITLEGGDDLVNGVLMRHRPRVNA